MGNWKVGGYLTQVLDHAYLRCLRHVLYILRVRRGTNYFQSYLPAICKPPAVVATVGFSLVALILWTVYMYAVLKQWLWSGNRMRGFEYLYGVPAEPLNAKKKRSSYWSDMLLSQQDKDLQVASEMRWWSMSLKYITVLHLAQPLNIEEIADLLSPCISR